MRKSIFILAMIALSVSLAGCSTEMHMTKPDYAYTMPRDVRPPPPPAGSIWAGVNSSNALFADKKARYVNDVLTIIIEESSEGANNAKTDTNKESTLAAGFTGIFQGANPTNTILSPVSVGGSLSNKLQGEGKTKRDSNLKARITARVMSVLENGNLLVEGRRQLSVNAEDQYIIITGVVRPEDITTENTISSQYIADARIVYGGRGVVNDKQRPGWGTRLLDWVWPF